MSAPDLNPNHGEAPGGMGWTAGMSDTDLRQTMLAAMRLLLGLAAVGTVLLWWKLGWQSAALLLIGAAIAAASLWEWMRLITLMNHAMDASASGAPGARPMGLTVVGFFLRIGLTVGVLYVSLKYLNGTAFALLAGIGLGLFSLMVEALRLVKRWTV
jgi:hypothetical protein